MAIKDLSKLAQPKSECTCVKKWEQNGSKDSERGKVDPKCPAHGEKYDEDGNRLFRPPLMTMDEVANTKLILEEFMKSSHGVAAPEEIKKPIRSATDKFARMFAKPKVKVPKFPLDHLPAKKK